MREELSFTRNVSSEVELTLWLGESKVSATGVVVSSHPSFGNGIKFTHLTEESKGRLRDFIQSLDEKISARRKS